MKDITLYKNSESLFLKEIKKKTDVSKEDNCDGYLLNMDEKEARRTIESLKKDCPQNRSTPSGAGKIIAVKSRDEMFNRRAVETLKMNYLVLGLNFEKDSLKQRASGLNHVVAKEAAKKGASFVIDYSLFNNIDKREKARQIAKIIQNIVICRKTKCPIKIASFAKNENERLSEIEAKNFCFSLGMSSQQVAKVFDF